MSILAEAVLSIAGVLGGSLLRVVRRLGRMGGSRFLFTAFLFCIGLGVAGVVVHDALHGHHPLLTLGFAFATGLGLVALASGLET